MFPNSVREIDREIFLSINQDLSFILLDVPMRYISSHSVHLLFPFIIYLFIILYRREGSLFKALPSLTLLVTLGSFLLSDWLSNELKNIIQTVRPCHTIEGVRLLVGCSKSFSMPSSHASNAVAVALPLFLLTRKTASPFMRWYLIIAAFFIAYSRAYVGVHYPSDIVAGLLLGTLSSIFTILLYKTTREYFKISPYESLLFLFLIVIGFFRVYYILNGPLNLSPDEAHYWDWSRRPDWSYYSKGPLVAFIISFSTFILGNNELGVRMPAVIFGLLSSIVMYSLVLNLTKEKLPALISALLLQVVPLFATYGIIFTTDSPFIFFWLLSLLLFFHALKSDHRWWAVTGVSIGLGLLAKYTMALFFPCALIFLLYSKNRTILKTVHPYLAIAVSLLVFSPVMIWNHNHNWLTLKHTAGQAHIYDGIEIHFTYYFEFLGSQAGIVSPLLFIMMLYALFKPDATCCKKIETGKFLFSFSVPVLAFFLLKSIQGKVQANWAVTGYITGMAAFSLCFFGCNSTDQKRSITILKWSALSVVLLFSVLSHYPSVLNLSPDMDSTSRLRGWRELGEEVSKINESLKEKGHVLIFSDRYQVTGELAFYVKDNPVTFCISRGRRMNQYDLWPGLNEAAAQIRSNENTTPPVINGIYVSKGDKKLPDEAVGSFERFEKRLLIVYDREYVLREYSIFIGYNFMGIEEKPIERF